MIIFFGGVVRVDNQIFQTGFWSDAVWTALPYKNTFRIQHSHEGLSAHTASKNSKDTFTNR
jgi:hypothetical protein